MIGVDIVSIKRIEIMVEKYKDKFLSKFLNKSEIELVKIKSKFNIHRIAGFFATKEALSKALKCGISEKIGFLDITIKKDKLGAPEVYIDNKIKNKFNINNIEVSISHDNDYAISFIIINTKEIQNRNNFILINLYLSILTPKILKSDLHKLIKIDLKSLENIILLDLKSPNLAIFLSILLGIFGIDRIYIKDYKKALLKIVFCFTLVFWIIDLFYIIHDTKKKNLKIIMDSIKIQ